MKEKLINQIIELIDELIDVTECDDNPEFHYKLYDMMNELKGNSELHLANRKRINEIFNEIHGIFPIKLHKF